MNESNIYLYFIIKGEFQAYCKKNIFQIDEVIKLLGREDNIIETFPKELKGLIDTKCDYIKSSDSASNFYLICTPVSFEKETSYSLVILSDITIGSDTSEVFCTYGSYKLYKKIIIPSKEYDFLILYDENNSPYLDCNVNNKGFYHYTVSKVTNYCGSCNYNV